MIVWVNRFFLRKGFSGMAFWPFIILKNKKHQKDVVFMNHERIHLRQQAELLLIFFYLWYVTEFFLRWAQFKNRREAYRNISFEREAYNNEKDLFYLKKRPLFNFFNFL